MKKINLLLCLFFLSTISLMAQQNYEDVVFLKNGSIIRGTIVEQVPNQSIKVKTKDGNVFVYNFTDVEKMTKEPIVNNSIYGNQNNPKYKISKKALPERVKYEKQSFVLVGVALHPSQTSGYIMYGKLKNYGGYVKLQSNLNFKMGYDVVGDSYANRYFNDNVHTGRLGISGGALWRVLNPVILYGGIGYGSRWVNWETISGDQFRVQDASYRGVELEAGAIFKVKKMFFTGGISWIPVSYMELSIGAGFSL